jgi:acetoin utilization protein AcuC
MTCILHVAWDERVTDYHFGPDHPLAPVRVELTMRLAQEFGLWHPAQRLATSTGRYTTW